MHLPGRQPALEVLRHRGLEVQRILIASSARGADIDAVHQLANERSITVDVVGERRLDELADPRWHQGVVTHVIPPAPWPLESWLSERVGRRWTTNVVVLDGVHNPSNVGLILRSAAAADVDAVVMPRSGTAEIGPLTIKAGSGMIFAVDIVSTETTAEALDTLSEANFVLYGMDAAGDDLFDADLSERAAYVLGNETLGLSNDARDRIDRSISLPLSNGVESLNVAAAAAVVLYELARRKRHRVRS